MTGQPNGRPSMYSPELEDKICEALASGKSMREICKEPHMPSRETINRWKHENRAFCDRYNESVEDRAELMASQLLDIADNLTGDPQRDRLRLDTRKWIACKLFPKKYGDKVNLDANLTGSIIIQTTPLDEKL